MTGSNLLPVLFLWGEFMDFIENYGAKLNKNG